MIAYLGPAIGPDHFEVGPEVRDAACTSLAGAAAFFVPHGSGKYLADLFALGRLALAQVGVDAVFGGGICTYCDADRFYSHRRDRVTGRHAALIWLAGLTGSFDRAGRDMENPKTTPRSREPGGS